MNGTGLDPSPRLERTPRLPPAEVEPFLPENPVDHAFTLYDQARFPELVRFVTCRVGGRLRAYLLIWEGEPALPEVHWLGSDEPWEELAESLPPRPFVATVPPRLTELIERVRGPTRVFPLDVMVRPAAGVPPLRSEDGRTLVRRLEAHDLSPLEPGSEFSHALPPSLLKGGSGPRAYGAFRPEEGNRPLAVARTLVELPGLWVLGGIFTEPDHRRQGLAEAVTTRLVEEAHQRGADCALYVRSDNEGAVRLYRGLGFVFHHALRWIDAGAFRTP